MEQNDKLKWCETLTFANKLSDNVVAALEAGEGGNTIGLSNGAVCGVQYKVIDIEFCKNISKPENWVKPVDVNTGLTKEWGDLSEEEQIAEGGRKIKWFTLVTDKGNISFTQFFGSSAYDSQDFWKDADQVIKGFSVANRVCPIAKSPRLWIKHNCKVVGTGSNETELIGQTIYCAASKDFENEVTGFKEKARLFIFGTLPENCEVKDLKKERAEEAEKKAKENQENPDDVK